MVKTTTAVPRGWETEIEKSRPHFSLCLQCNVPFSGDMGPGVKE